jgi:hypothetical protein
VQGYPWKLKDSNPGSCKGVEMGEWGMYQLWRHSWEIIYLHLFTYISLFTAVLYGWNKANEPPVGSLKSLEKAEC